MNRALFPTAAAMLVLFFSACAAPKQPQPKPAPTHHCAGKAPPDKQLCAHIVEVGKHPAPLNESRVDILDANGQTLASRSFKSSDGEHGRSVARSDWTPNSRFFVFSTQSSGGHSPWHWQTYFYDRKKNTFRELDDSTGPIIKRDFQLSAPDVAHVTVQGTPSDPGDIVTGTPKQVHLGAL
jgi:hypothetical protein